MVGQRKLIESATQEPPHCGRLPRSARSRPCRRFVRLSRPSQARAHRKPENRTSRLRAGMLRKQQAQKETACGRFSAEERATSGEAGQSRGVVRAPRRSHLPAVRAVWGFRGGVVAGAKIAPLGSERQKASLFQGKQRGHALKLEEYWHGRQQDQVSALADAGV